MCSEVNIFHICGLIFTSLKTTAEESRAKYRPQNSENVETEIVAGQEEEDKTL